MVSVAPRCEGKEYGLIIGRRHKRYQMPEAVVIKPPFTPYHLGRQQRLPVWTTWFLAFYLVGQAKTGISSLALRRHLRCELPERHWVASEQGIMQANGRRDGAYLSSEKGAGG